jgi:hypothetical protein
MWDHTLPQTVQLKPDWPKGYSRMGAAQLGLQRWDDAVETYQRGAAFKHTPCPRLLASLMRSKALCCTGQVPSHAPLPAGLEVDSDNAQMKEGLADAKRGKERSESAAGGGAGGLFGPDFMAKLVRLSGCSDACCLL